MVLLFSAPRRCRIWPPFLLWWFKGAGIDCYFLLQSRGEGLASRVIFPTRLYFVAIVDYSHSVIYSTAAVLNYQCYRAGSAQCQSSKDSQGSLGGHGKRRRHAGSFFLVFISSAHRCAHSTGWWL
ncbi:hypothetical protein QBC38DRAFT_466548 [Podospora fimiseda]|uniref:Uncharacterized protein n=1 Tax=Podospora fimiseda TaxID=252190 RepID=A0AAN7H7X1_9PEZI|nr:hypothetical protein QBC38DRAFT_466548 [Podospora fimiseda]